MTSTLGFALVGLLAREPATGYDLAQQLRRPVGWFWTARHSQIYPELARLEQARLVRHVVIQGAGPRDTKRYSVTAAGRREVRAWLLSTTPDVDDRQILLRVYLLFVLRPEEATGVVQAIREHHGRTLATYLDLDRTPRSTPWSADVTSDATLEWGIAFERGRIDWCDGLLADLQRRATLPTVTTQPTR